jgi:hypothetical protein
MAKYSGCAFVLLILANSGCTHMQLRKHTNQRLRTTSEITQQQIMDNVAKISANENAWPEFSNFSSGLTQVTDSAGGSLGLTWNATTIVQEALGISASRSLVDNWGTTATTDPARLRAMWAVYYYTVYGVVPKREDYDADLQLKQVFGTDQWQKLIPAPGWFRVYCDHEYCEDVECGCVVGRHCDTRACVLPGSQEQLQRLTYAIMHISSSTYIDPTTKLPAPFPTGISLPPVKTAIPFNTTEELPTPGPAKDFNMFSPGPVLTP